VALEDRPDVARLTKRFGTTAKERERERERERKAKKREKEREIKRGTSHEQPMKSSRSPLAS